MKHILINGVEVDVPIENSNLHELIQKIRNDFSNESSLISSIRINGIEIDAQDETVIGRVPVTELKSIEVFTAHPREIAEETLQSLIEFASHLEALCKSAASLLLQTPPKTDQLPKLADGITTFIDALANVKTILHVGAMNKVQVLEADLLSILKDMLDFQRKSEFHFVGSVVKDALVPNLEQWRTDGIPALIRLRDS
jgi:hypothetical protein